MGRPISLKGVYKMPTAANRLTPKSSPQEIKDAISACIKQLMDEGGREQKQCEAICYSMARKATKKESKYPFLKR